MAADRQNSPRTPSSRTNKPRTLKLAPVVDLKCSPSRAINLSFKRAGKSKPGSAMSSPRTPSSDSSGTPGSVTRGDELREVFRYFDGNGDGKICALELRAYFGSIGEYMSYQDAEAVIRDVDSDGDKMLDFADFVRLMDKDGGHGGGSEEEEDLRKAFEMFEGDKGSGLITPRGLQRMLHRLGDSKSYDECVAMIQVFDSTGNGVLDFQEFKQMMMA